MHSRLTRKKGKKTEQKRISRSCKINDGCVLVEWLGEKGSRESDGSVKLSAFLTHYQKQLTGFSFIDNRLISRRILRQLSLKTSEGQ